MGALNSETTFDALTFPLSRRAARRLIQRGFVLLGRDRQVRQHLREIRLSTRWRLEDWDFEWTVIIDRGALNFERRLARQPDLILTWPSAAEFFRDAENGVEPGSAPEVEGHPEFRRLSDFLCRHLFLALYKIIKHPYDEAGNRLV